MTAKPIAPKGDDHGEYRRALAALIDRVQQALKDIKPGSAPIKMYLAGGAALNLLTGARATEDVDATFSRRVLFDGDIEISYRDAGGRARLLYLDRNYNDRLGLMHEDAYTDSKPVAIPGIDRKIIDVRTLAPVDLAVSKLSRFSDQDREDMEVLARAGLIDSASLRKRGEEALGGYVGNLTSVRLSLDRACRVIEAARPVRRRRDKPA